MATATTSHPDPLAGTIPPLENGDRLTRPEFERRYDAMPDLKKAELINGVVHMPPPVSWDGHATPHFDLITWLGLYRIATAGLKGGDNGSIRLDLDNMPQPDAFLLILPKFGGHARISADDYVVGGPELVAEVASSTASYDLHGKLDVYRRHGVTEYVVWKTRDRAVAWFTLRDGLYEPLLPGTDGIIRSEVFPGLWLDPAALIRGDMPRVARVANQGLVTPEHAAFVERLKAAETPGG